MSVYYNKKLISGVREVPQMTLAEYNALTNKPKLWLRTDAPSGDRGINADDIPYDNNTSVKEKIDGLIKIKEVSYTLSGNNLIVVNDLSAHKFISVMSKVGTYHNYLWRATSQDKVVISAFDDNFSPVTSGSGVLEIRYSEDDLY